MNPHDENCVERIHGNRHREPNTTGPHKYVYYSVTYLGMCFIKQTCTDAHIKKRVPNPLICISNIGYRNSVNPNRKKCMWNSLERGQQQLSQSGHMSYFSARTVWRVRSLNHAHASFSCSRFFRLWVRWYASKIQGHHFQNSITLWCKIHVRPGKTFQSNWSLKKCFWDHLGMPNKIEKSFGGTLTAIINPLRWALERLK